jgi:NO-binding membrane sensor protein with MHYT domain
VAGTQELAYGWLPPALAYGVSVLGSLLGLLCTSKARQGGTLGRRAGWLTGAAISIGGAGIWLMHFLGMISFAVDGSDVRYGIGLTVVSALIGIVVVGIGLVILGTADRPKARRVFSGGLFTGLGVAGMHYTGMAAMQVDGTISYDLALVAASIVIAVVAATAALWFTIVARNVYTIAGAALIMGVAVNGMHYVGMHALRVKLDHVHSISAGIDLTTAVPLIAGLTGTVVSLLLYVTLSIPSHDERMMPVEVCCPLAARGPADPSNRTPRASPIPAGYGR